MLRPAEDYLRSLLEYLRRERPDINARLFAALLLCLVAGERNLLVRTEEDDIVDVAVAAMNIIVSIFGLPTQRVHIRRQDNPDLFLKSIFLVPPPSTSVEHLRHPSYHHGGVDAGASPVGSKAQRLSTDLETSSSSASKPTATSPASSRQFHRGSHITSVDDASISGIPPASGHGFPLDVLPGHRRDRTSNSNLSNFGHDENLRGSQLIAPTRVASYSRHYTTRDTPSSRSPKLPHALVLTRLERAGIATQSALAEVLRTRVVPICTDESGSCGGRDDEVREWNLPSGFFVVYVCGIGNGKNRPALPSFMLDAFAFNATVLLDAPLHQFPPALLRSTGPLVSIADIEELRSLVNARTYISPYLDTYIMNLLFAARHHSHLEGVLLSARCTRDMEDFIRTACVLFNVPYAPNGFKLNNETNGNGTMSQKKPPEDAVPSGHHPKYSADLLPTVYSCTEKDVDRVFAGVLAHRLAVRSPIEGPLRSMLLTAADVPGALVESAKATPPNDDATTVYSVLAGILRSV